jgi:hypothetical protein
MGIIAAVLLFAKAVAVGAETGAGTACAGTGDKKERIATNKDATGSVGSRANPTPAKSHA